MEVWRAHYATLANEEFSWDKSSLTEEGVLSGPSERISEEEVRRAVAKMKCNKAAGLSGVVADMPKSASETCLQWVTGVCNLPFTFYLCTIHKLLISMDGQHREKKKT